MLVKNAFSALVATAAVAEAAITYRAVAHADSHHAGVLSARQDNARQGGNQNGKNNNNQGKNNNGGNAGGNAGGAAGANCLAANAVQANSNQQGQPAAGQSNSQTDANNFINFCADKGTLTNGEQVQAGSCNGIPMGQIPSTGNMVSTIIKNPPNMGNIAAETTFDVELTVQNMVLGTFTDPARTYYSAPQQLQGGKVVGHTHVTIQDVGNDIQRNTPMNPQAFVFFKGVNDAGDGNGNVAATVEGGLPDGTYRVCTMSGASNHQPVLMPVAQRGSQEDCRYFTVGGAAGGGNNNAGGGNNNAGKNNAGAGNAGGNAGAGKNNAGAGNAGGAGNQAGNAGAGNGGNAGGNAGAGNQNQGAGGNNGNQGAGKNNAGGAAGNAGGNAGNAGGNAGNANNGTEAGGQQGNNGQGNGAADSGANAGNGNNGNNGASIAGIEAEAVTNVGGARPFQVDGATFVNEGAAKQRACAVQNNKCSNAVNSGQAAGSTVADCNAQQTACNAA